MFSILASSQLKGAKWTIPLPWWVRVARSTTKSDAIKFPFPETFALISRRFLPFSTISPDPVWITLSFEAAISSICNFPELSEKNDTFSTESFSTVRLAFSKSLISFKLSMETIISTGYFRSALILINGILLASEYVLLASMYNVLDFTLV